MASSSTSESQAHTAGDTAGETSGVGSTLWSSTKRLSNIAEADEIELQKRDASRSRSRPSSLKSGRSGAASAKSAASGQSVGLALSFREGSLRELPPDVKFGLDLPKFSYHCAYSISTLICLSEP